MKTYKSKTLLLTLLLTTSLNVAHAQSFGDMFTSFKDKAAEVAKQAGQAASKAGAIAQQVAKDATAAATKATETVVVNEDQTVTDSLLVVSGTRSADVQWIMVIVTKDNYISKTLFPAPNGVFNAKMALGDGSGIYDVRVLENKNDDRYTSYLQFKTFKADNTDSRDMSFLLPTPKVQSDDARIVDLVKDVTKDAQNDEEAFHAIYNYVTSTIKYDMPSYKDGSFAKKDYNALAALDTQIAVCEGYANLVAAMSRAYGIKTKVIFGKAQLSADRTGDHAWNEVFINDEWKVVDATWDAGRKNQSYYFMDADKFAQDHFKEQEMNY